MTRHQHIAICIAAVVFGFSFLARYAAAADNPNPRAASIGEAMHARELAARTVVLKWRCKEARGDVKAVSPFDKEQPAEIKLVVNTYERTLELDGDCVRLEDSAPQWDIDRRRFLPSQQTKVVNQRVSKSLSKLEMPAGLAMQGIIAPREKGLHSLRSQFDLLPVLEHFRPSWRLETLLIGVKSEVEQAVVANHTCAIFQTRRANSTGVRTVSYWCDLARDYLILRVIHEVNGKVFMQEDRDYQEIREHGWIPSRWKSVEFLEDGSIKRSLDAELVSAKLNEPIPADRFDLLFPEGTRIIDSTHQTQGLRGHDLR